MLQAWLAFFAIAACLQGAEAATGGQFCAPSQKLCVNALVDGSDVTFQLRSTFGYTQLGWMAVGFGQHMPNSPMVITWPNPDGSITISQREALAHVMPTYIPNPPQKANLVLENSILAANSTTIAFTYPTPSPLNAVNMIFAYCLTRPSSSAPDATLQQHLDMGTFTIDLTQPMNALPTGIISTAVIGSSTEIVAATPTGAPASSTPIAASVLPLTPEEERIRTHGILMSIGFLVLLPLGVFIARFSRTIPFLQRKWFTAHWVVQFIVSGPIIFAGWALGYQHVQRTGGGHFQDSHTKLGLVLLILYLVQMLWGVIIHFFRPPAPPLPPVQSASDPEKHLDAPANPPRSPASSATMNVTDSPQATFSDLSGSPPRKPTATTPAPRPLSSALSPDYLPSKAPKVNRYEALFNRPLQNYGHAINGLVIIALAFHNVREGYHDEWEQEFGENYKMRAFLRHLNTWWVAWVIIIPCVYILGLHLLPRQWNMELEARRQKWRDEQAKLKAQETPASSE